MSRSLALAGLRLQPLAQLGSLSASVESLVCGSAAENRAIHSALHVSSQHCCSETAALKSQLQGASKSRGSAIGSLVDFYSHNFVHQKVVGVHSIALLMHSVYSLLGSRSEVCLKRAGASA